MIEMRDPKERWGELSQQERDDAYNNNKAVAGSAALIEERNAASARVRAAHRGALDLPYGDGERTRIDLFPSSVRGAPCFIFIHGGYWQFNSRELFAAVAEGFAEHGWSVAIPGYTLAPQATLTQIVGEIRRSIDWLDADGQSFGIEGPMVLGGWSAGAQLAALALDHPRISAGLAISGVFDLAPIRDTYLNTALHLTEMETEALSPLRLPPVSKPLAIAYGTAELPALIGDSLRLHAARSEAGAPGPLLPVQGADHFTILNELRKVDGMLLRAAVGLVGSLA